MSKSENVLNTINKRLVISEENMTKLEAKAIDSFWSEIERKHRKKLKQVLMSCRMTSISLI